MKVGCICSIVVQHSYMCDDDDDEGVWCKGFCILSITDFPEFFFKSFVDGINSPVYNIIFDVDVTINVRARKDTSPFLLPTNKQEQHTPHSHSQPHLRQLSWM
jgi:hypothetical protein